MTDQDKELQNQPQDPDPNSQDSWQEGPKEQAPQNDWQDSPQNPGAQPGPGGQQSPYGSGQPPYGQNPYGNGQPPYGQNPYGNGQQPYGQNPYGNGQPPYRQNPYGNGQPPYGQNPYGSGPWPNQPYRGPESPKQKNSYATVSLVSGIFGLLTLCCMAFPIAIILGVGAIAFAVISKQGRPMTGPAIAGTILGAFCIVLGIGEFLYILAVSAFMKDPENAAMFNEIYNQLEQQMNQMNH